MKINEVEIEKPEVSSLPARLSEVRRVCMRNLNCPECGGIKVLRCVCAGTIRCSCPVRMANVLPIGDVSHDEISRFESEGGNGFSPVFYDSNELYGG